MHPSLRSLYSSFTPFEHHEHGRFSRQERIIGRMVHQDDQHNTRAICVDCCEDSCCKPCFVMTAVCCCVRRNKTLPETQNSRPANIRVLAPANQNRYPREAGMSMELPKYPVDGDGVESGMSTKRGGPRSLLPTTKDCDDQFSTVNLGSERVRYDPSTKLDHSGRGSAAGLVLAEPVRWVICRSLCKVSKSVCIGNSVQCIAV